MDLSKYHKKGYTGLVNLGNTCFLNSCMQVLNHTYELNEFLSSKKCQRNMKNDVSDSIIVNEWNDLRKVMWSNNGVVSPNKFVHNVHDLANKKDRDIFTGWAQNDMPEFLLFMIECMHNSISRGIVMRITGNVENPLDKMATECYGMLQKIYAKDYSEIMDYFYGIYVSEIISLDGAVIHTVKPESFFMLDLPLPPENIQTPSIYDCFDLFTKSEILEGDNAWLNESTGKKEDIQKRITYWNFPKILVITLKRFSPDGMHKRNDQIQFPIDDLNLSKYVSGYNPNQYVYDLYGVCNHMGNTNGGHYTAFVKNSENKWIHFNDSQIDVNIDPQRIITPMAYCLFYRKKNNFV